MTSATDPLQSRTTLIYDGQGNLVEKHEGAGTPQEAVTYLAYDFLDRLARVTDPMGNLTSYDYTGSPGCPSCGGGSNTIPAGVTDPFGKLTSKMFDKAGRVVAVTDPLSNATRVMRDAAGRPAMVTDGNDNSTTYTYDAIGRISEQTDANSGNTSFKYDAFGNLASLIDANGNQTTFEYDPAGRKTKETRPMGQATEYAYYPNGLLKTVKDAKGQLTTYSYDAANRLSEVKYADGRKDTFGYDPAGNMTSYSNGGASGTITYDESNRKISETVKVGSFSKSFSYSYDARGNKQSFTSPEGTIYTYGYNKNDQPTSISFGGRQVTFDYDGGRLSRTTFPNGISTDFGYNDASWLSGITTKNTAGTIDDNQYEFDKVGNIKSKSSFEGSSSYGYDDTYQVTNATHPSLAAEAFGYDKVGNRITSSDGDGSVSYAHDTNNETTSAGSATFGYDANGNTVTKSDGEETTTYVYNSADRLERVLLPDGSTAVYTYDPFGRRVKKDVSGVVTYYVYSDEGLIGEYSASGSFQKGYGWKPNGIWGTDPVFMTEGGSYYFYSNDHLGTPQQLIDDSGNVVWSAEYSAFGEATVDPAATVENNLRFPGQYFDEETGLHYNWQRYYDPETGRYTQADPLRLLGRDANLYRYTGNGPANAEDPFGLLGYSGSLATDASILVDVVKEDWSSGAAVDRAINAFKAELSITSGIGAALLIPETFGLSAGHAVGNIAGGVGDYLNVISPRSKCEGGNRDWNVGRKGFEWVSEKLTGDPTYGKRAFYITDAAFGLYGLFKTTPLVVKTLKYGVEFTKFIPEYQQIGRIQLIHDSYQVIDSLKSAGKRYHVN